MAIKLGNHEKLMNSNARFNCSSVASGFLSALTLETPEAREIKRREKVRCELVESQFGIGGTEESVPLIDRISQMLKLA